MYSDSAWYSQEIQDLIFVFYDVVKYYYPGAQYEYVYVSYG